MLYFMLGMYYYVRYEIKFKKQKTNLSAGVIEIDVKDLTSRYTNDVIFSCAFGLKVDSHNERENQFYKIGKITATFGFIRNLLFSVGFAYPGLINVSDFNYIVIYN